MAGKFSMEDAIAAARRAELQNLMRALVLSLSSEELRSAARQALVREISVDELLEGGDFIADGPAQRVLDEFAAAGVDPDTVLRALYGAILRTGTQ